MARISFDDGGTLFMEADTPYEQELLFDCLDEYASLRGHVSVQLDRRGWNVAHASEPSRRCVTCNGGLRGVVYALGQRVFCPRCARDYCTTTVRGIGSRKPPKRKEASWIGNGDALPFRGAKRRGD